MHNTPHREEDGQKLEIGVKTVGGEEVSGGKRKSGAEAIALPASLTRHRRRCFAVLVRPGLFGYVRL